MTPALPIFYDDNGDVSVHDSVANLATYLQSPHLEPEEFAYDAAGRRLRIAVSGKTVTIELAEDAPTHAAELRTLLSQWLESVDRMEGGSLANATLPQLVERSRKHLTRWDARLSARPVSVRMFVIYLAIMVGLMVAGLWLALRA